MRLWSGPYPNVENVLFDMFIEAVARCGQFKQVLQLDTPCNKNSNHQWEKFIKKRDSIAFISWCADKIRFWHAPEYMMLMRQSPLYGVPEQFSFAIMSPDHQTDWTMAAWHIHRETQSTLQFTKDIMNRMEAALAT